MKLDLKVLRKIAEEATPGPWEAVGSSVTDWSNGTFTMEWLANGQYPNLTNDLVYFTVMNPETILALIDALEDTLPKESPKEDSLDIAVQWTKEYLQEFHPKEEAEVLKGTGVVLVRFADAGPILPTSLNGHPITTERRLGTLGSREVDSRLL